MKKSVFLLGFLFIVFALGFGFVSAANVTDTQQVNDAYKCLLGEIEDRGCSNLYDTEQIFSLLATGQCKQEVIDGSDNNQCWPDERCNIKTTAQAILALSKKGVNTDEAQSWLLDQRVVPSDLNWYLEIESEEKTSCNIRYDGDVYNVDIGEDKIIDGSAGSCLSLGPGGYWLQINPVCYEEEFEISCDEQFLSTLIFQRQGSQTIHVLDVTHSRPADGTSLEKIDSFCFSTGSTCDYTSNAWAAMVLDIVGKDISPYMPYLVTAKEREHFPEPFLYTLTGFSEYRTGIMNQQINEQYWRVSKDKYYDTALALLPFQGETLIEKDNAIKWLLELQQEDGCWDGGNINNNAFLLYSLWPRASSVPTPDDGEECPDNYFCEVSGNCESENVMSEFSCFGSKVCCSQEYIEPTCAELGGKVCNYNQYCDGEETYTAGSYCCTGACKEVQTEPEEMSSCEVAFGICDSFCDEGLVESSEYECNSYSDVCCMEENKPGLWWIWVLFALIILVIVAIIYRDKLRIAIFKATGKKDPSMGKGAPRDPRSGMPPAYNRMPQRRPPIQRKIVPQPRPVTRPPVQRPKSNRELDDVLKKLKDMSN